MKDFSMHGPEGLPNSPARLAFGVIWLFGIIAALLPMMPIYLDSMGVVASNIAFLMSIHAGTALIVAQVCGYLADTYFKRTHMLIAMSIMGSLVFALFPLLGNSLPRLCLGMVAVGMFVSQRIALYNSLMLESKRGEELFGKIRLAGSVGFAVIALGIGKLADLPSLTPAIMFPVLVIIELILTICVIKLSDLPAAVRQQHNTERISFREAQKRLLANPLIPRFLLFIFLIQSMAAPGYLLQVKLLKVIDSSSFFVMGCVAFAAIAEISVFYFGNQILSRIRLMPLFALVPVALLIRYLIIAVYTSPWPIFFSNALHIFTFGLSYLCGVMFIHREVLPELKSSGQTLFGMVFSTVSNLFGNFVLGILLAWLTSKNGWGYTDLQALRFTFALTGVLGMLSFLAWWPMKRAYQKKHNAYGIIIRHAPTG